MYILFLAIENLRKRDFISHSNLQKILKTPFNKDKRDDVSDFDVCNYVVYYLTRALTEKCFCGIFYYNCMINNYG